MTKDVSIFNIAIKEEILHRLQKWDSSIGLMRKLNSFDWTK